MTRLSILAFAAAAGLAATAFAQEAPPRVQLERAQAQLQQAQVQAPAQTQTAVVPANALWAPTPVEVRAGARLEISVSPDMRWSAIPRQQTTVAVVRDPYVDANGYVDTVGQRTLLPSANRGALIGKIGENGAPFLIGLSYAGEASADGRLFLSMNEFPDQFADNQGRLAASIAMTPPPPPPVEQPTPEETAPEEAPVEEVTPAPTDVTQEATPVEETAPPPVVSPELLQLVLVLLAAVAGLFLVLRIFRPRSGGSERGYVTAPQVSARIVNDGLLDQSLSISMERRS
jgi:hypothetical protein